MQLMQTYEVTQHAIQKMKKTYGKLSVGARVTTLQSI